MIRLGYDGITTVMVTYIATQVGFATPWMNPFSVAIAQGIADVPVLSGAPFRMVLWVFFTLVGIAFTMSYAAKVKKNPAYSFSIKGDAVIRDQALEEHESRWNPGDNLVLLTVTLTTIWVVWCVVAHSWYLPEIASQFFTMGVVAGLLGVVFKLNNMTINDIAASFKEGAGLMLAPALLVGFAKGVLLILGGGDPSDPSVLVTRRC